MLNSVKSFLGSIFKEKYKAPSWFLAPSPQIAHTDPDY